MSRWLITFSGAGYEGPTQRTVADGRRYGAGEVYVYDDAWLLRHPFYGANRWLWDHRSANPAAPPGRGCGWYAWKPLVLLDALDHVPPGGVVLYCDGDTYPVADLGPIYGHAAEHGAMFFAASGHQHHRWCTRDCLVVMGQDRALLQAKRYPHPVPDYQHTQHGTARFMAIKQGAWRPKQLLMEWLTYAVNPMATTFEPSVLGAEHPEFTEHRTEQAILTLLCHKHGYKLHREADQSGDGHPEDRELYGQLFEQVHQGGNPHPPTGSPYRRVPGAP